ncbi:phosphopantetheine-binding protein [Rhodococcus sp. 2G]|uniref:phosphopantetheine-binding protein n=1 Tax=Rhodococcus sp. 2G TaxID=1570939 RepID=UPI00090435F2|nr:phosphopantetheine-binding protein [Rhodococcus sp. 2G]
MPAAISPEQMKEDVASALGVTPKEISDATNLVDAGLDSIRLMQLVEKWRAEGSADADFAILAGTPTLGEWVAAIVGK